MSSIGSISPVTWARPQSTAVRRPSWIGASLRESPSPPPPSERKGSPVSEKTPPSGSRRAVKSSPPPSVIPKSTRDLTAFSAPIRTTREVELEGEVLGLRAEVARLVEQLASVRASVLEESEPAVVELAVAVAEKIVGRELALDPTMISRWIEEGLAGLPTRDGVTVAVSPEIASMISPSAAAELGIVVDPTLRGGTCEVRQGSTTVEVGADARLMAITDALGLSGDPR